MTLEKALWHPGQGAAEEPKAQRAVLLTGPSGKYSEGVTGEWDKVISILSHSPQSCFLLAHVNRETFATRPFPALGESSLCDGGVPSKAVTLPSAVASGRGGET